MRGRGMGGLLAHLGWGGGGGLGGGGGGRFLDKGGGGGVGALGGAGGALVAHAVPAEWLRVIMPVVLVAVALFFAFKPGQIGRASCRERGLISVGAASLKNKREYEMEV